MATQELMDQAVVHHRAGRLAEAEAIYRRVLAEEPNQPNALHLLGLLAFAVGRSDVALDCIGRAIAIDPKVAEFYVNRGVVLDGLGRWTEAAASFLHALELGPNVPEAHVNLANVLRKLGKPDEAVAACRRALGLRPDYTEAHLNLGNALQDKGDWDGAIVEFQHVVRLQPDFAEGYFNLGSALDRKGKLDESLAALRRALEIKPQYHQAANALGAGFLRKGDADQAIVALRQALSIKADFVPAMVNLGQALRGKGSLDEAAALMGRAISLQPTLVEAHLGMGMVQYARRDWEAAAVAFRQAVVLRPNSAEAQGGLANMLFASGNHQAAIAAYHQALAADPDHQPSYFGLGLALTTVRQFDRAILALRRAAALAPRHAQAHAYLGATLWIVGEVEEALVHLKMAAELSPGDASVANELGNAYVRVGLLDEAIACYARAVALKPDYAGADSNRLFAILFHPGYDAAAIVREHRSWDQRHGQALKGLLPPMDVDRAPARRLRVGYVSGDFRDHIVGRTLLPLLREHDHAAFEVFCYSNVREPDGMTEQFKSLADAWCDIAAMDDQRAAERIREDRMDLLVDVNMHMAGGRPLIFARKPAAVQVAFGYPAGTGLDAMDWRITDPRLDPAGETDGDYVENSHRLPDSFWCYDAAAMQWESSAANPPLEVGALPALQNGYVTFGCLNNFSKVNDAVLDVWKRVLETVSNSRLVLLAPAGEARQRALKRLGVDAGRVEFVPHQARIDYLKKYNAIDICLDTWPYNGHATSLDAMWMGVPVVNFVGKTAAGRAGLSQLHCMGLEELAARDGDQFVKIAAGLAEDLPRLTELRRTLRQRLADSALGDAKNFARNVEAGYRHMWKEFISR